MIFRQLIHEDLGCASYLIGDEKAGLAAVVDPRFEVDGYLELARYLGVGIEHVFETHNHADHVSGHGRLVAPTRARSTWPATCSSGRSRWPARRDRSSPAATAAASSSAGPVRWWASASGSSTRTA